MTDVANTEENAVLSPGDAQGSAVPMHMYCMFCDTLRCTEIALLIEKTLGYRCISPVIIQRKWVKGTPVDVPHQWLPGYLFLYTEKAIDPHLNLRGIIRFLGKAELKYEDREFARMIYERNGLIGAARVLQVGERCRLADQLWENVHGVITRVDRSKKRCCIEFEFDRVKRTVWVGYDLVENDETQTKNDAV